MIRLPLPPIVTVQLKNVTIKETGDKYEVKITMDTTENMTHVEPVFLEKHMPTQLQIFTTVGSRSDTYAHCGVPVSSDKTS